MRLVERPPKSRMVARLGDSNVDWFKKAMKGSEMDARFLNLLVGQIKHRKPASDSDVRTDNHADLLKVFIFRCLDVSSHGLEPRTC